MVRLPRPLPAIYPTLALVGGAPAGAVIQKLLVSNDAAVRLAAAETATTPFSARRPPPALAKLLARFFSPSAQTRRCAPWHLMPNWRSAAAQQALIDRATNKSLDNDARLDAADALAQAVKLQAGGEVQDPAMFGALISLLNDKFEPLQAIAYIALAPVRGRSLSGAPMKDSLPPPAAISKVGCGPSVSRPRKPVTLSSYYKVAARGRETVRVPYNSSATGARPGEQESRSGFPVHT